ncbi:MAG: molybdopterin-binding protein [Eubacteriales bacterium]|jgi:molybdenum cofactor synthesis domain-containing protein|nr:molybdopterin-binding protein [Eubacteriales bacterium]
MLHVQSLDQAKFLLLNIIKKGTFLSERVHVSRCGGRVLAEDVVSSEDLPVFDRSAVDGFAVVSSDTFGASAAQPSLLFSKGEVKMGERAAVSLSAGECAVVWTGGELPHGADAMVMLEAAQSLPGGLIAVETSAAPGGHVVFRGDDVRAGDVLLPAGKRLSARDIGLLAALGVTGVLVAAQPRVGILSTGDELIDCKKTPIGGQIRDVNGAMLLSACKEAGADAQFCGIVPDEEAALLAAMREAGKDCDLLLVSGGSSAGAKDAVSRCLGKLGSVLFHGLALKPGKPTLAGQTEDTLVIGLPGHPAAAYLVFHALVRPLLAAMAGAALTQRTAQATLTQVAPSNHGREELLPVRLREGYAEPVALKSGLILPLTRADGYIRIPRDTEGLEKGAQVEVILF